MTSTTRGPRHAIVLAAITALAALGAATTPARADWESL